MLARIFVLIGSVVVLLLTVALVGPYFIDWTSYRSDFEREASRILGRDVTVSGAAKARLLPFPSIAFTGIEVASRRPGEPWLSIDSFSMDMELAPLLRGELLIVDMRIERPRAMLDVGEDGRIDWTLNPEIRLDPRQVAAERITLVDGEIGLRLRYEIKRELAPYIGLGWERKTGATADLARAAGDDPRSLKLLVGVRAWF